MDTDTASAVAITRVANSCVLLEINGHRILTDPWFTERWHLHRGEPLGMTVAELPPLTAVLSGHPAPNHWDRRALAQLHRKAETPVLVSTERMARQARALGFRRAENVSWGQTLQLAPGLTVEVVAAGRTLSLRNNAYVLSSGTTRVFFGGEISDVALLRQYRADHPPIDIALLPVNGLRPVLGPPLVMGPQEAVASAKILGAHTLVPIHDAHAPDPLYIMIRRHGSAADARRLAQAELGTPDVITLRPGQRWTHRAGAGG